MPKQKLLLSAVESFAFDDNSGIPTSGLSTEILLNGVIVKLSIIAISTTVFTELPLLYYGLHLEGDDQQIEDTDTLDTFLTDVGTAETGFAFHLRDTVFDYVPHVGADQGAIMIDHYCRMPVRIGDILTLRLVLQALNDANHAFTTAGVMLLLVIIEQVVY